MQGRAPHAAEERGEVGAQADVQLQFRAQLTQHRTRTLFIIMHIACCPACPLLPPHSRAAAPRPNSRNCRLQQQNAGESCGGKGRGGAKVNAQLK